MSWFPQNLLDGQRLDASRGSSQFRSGSRVPEDSPWTLTSGRRVPSPTTSPALVGPARTALSIDPTDRAAIAIRAGSSTDTGVAVEDACPSR